MREPVILSASAEIVTLSAGVATLDAQAARAVDAVWRACDAAVHAAKARGRDRVVAFDDDTRRVVASRRDLLSTVAELQERNRALREEARTDALTGLRNRLALDELLHAAAAMATAVCSARPSPSSTSTTSATSTTCTATRPATTRCAPWPTRSAAAPARPTSCSARVARSSWWCCRTPTADAAQAAAERIRGAVEALALAHAAPRWPASSP